jgi:hypothetical protein
MCQSSASPEAKLWLISIDEVFGGKLSAFWELPLYPSSTGSKGVQSGR